MTSTKLLNTLDKTAWKRVSNFFKNLTYKCQQLVTFPNSGKSYAGIRPDLRGLPIEGYVIFYRVLDDGIEILRVVSGRRNLPSLFDESQ
ncbi:MAG: type II toxin-antitoxin system RelE/ParE family toxin [Nostoc sp. ChiSLP01]|nr:type II toxin-antitoxin system RelE/ParE family toxin [Nostoc sp. CmiSLP01]MDZ8285503.1 type II toxin-antitoxin system RelE/ParE family toxin [Nostoc sp. ChiSLP01]